MGDAEQTILNFTQASRRANVSRRTIRRWHYEGMPTQWREGLNMQRELVVDEETLLAWKRQKMRSGPVHFYRLRKRLAEAGAPEPEIPAEILAQRATRAARKAARASDTTVEPEEADPPTEKPPVAWEEILRELPKLTASDEWDALDTALQDDSPGCRDVEAFTAEHLDAEDLPVLRSICAACDVLEQCQAFAIAEKPKLGFWAGMTARELRRGIQVDA